MRKATLAVYFSFVALSFSADWYASPTATTGSGTSSDPWPLYDALTQRDTVVGGDTLWLKAGTYSGNFYSTLGKTTNSRVTVRALEGLHSVTIQDGKFGVLRTTLTSGTTAAVIENSEPWQIAQVIIIGGENIQLGNRSSPTNWTLNRGWNGTTAAAHSIGDNVIVRAQIINHVGTNVTFRDLVITSVQSTNRFIKPGGTNNWYVSPGINLDVGIGNSVINCVIYNTGHPAIGWWDQGGGEVPEINGNIIWGTGIYDWNGANWIRGTCLYSQNSDGFVKVKNCISFRNFTEGMQAYGTIGKVNGFTFSENITMMNGNKFGVSVWDEQTPTTNNMVLTNWSFMDSPIIGYTSDSNRNITVVGNVSVAGGTFTIKQHISGVFTNNTILLDGTTFGSTNIGAILFSYPTYALSNSTWTWDRNRYYYTNHDNSLFGLVTLDYPTGSGKRTLSQWQSVTGFDANSTATNGWPTNILTVEVRRLDYNTNRFHIVVINTDTNRSTATVTIPGVNVGSYTLRDAQNYWTSTVGAFTDGTISVNLASTNVSEITGSPYHYINQHSNVRYPRLFNAFVVDVVPGKQIPARVTSGRFRKSISR